MFPLKRTVLNNKKLIIFAIVLFGTGLIFSLFMGSSINIGESTSISTQNLSHPPSFTGLLNTNTIVWVLTLLGGVSLGLTTIVNLLFNGVITGIALSKGLEFGLTKAFLLFVPHAIFELPAFWIAGAAGFKIPHEFIRYLRGKKDYIVNRRELKDFVYLALISFVLIVIAAWIEANVTMKIAEKMN